MLIEKNLATILVISFLIILWWRAVWSILDVLFLHLAKGKKALLITFDVASIVFIIAVLFLHPEFRETFH
jgi:presenilin-like A22 family membrane protease